uniref:Uncharacterized protein n=1 Tax=Leersia perrieri TaxID=77586 RepID=A0A0D9WK63_9ORYZ
MDSQALPPWLLSLVLSTTEGQLSDRCYNSFPIPISLLQLPNRQTGRGALAMLVDEQVSLVPSLLKLQSPYNK